MNPSITIGSINPQIISLESATGIGWNSDIGRNSGDRISPRNIRSFSLFDRGTSDFSDKSALRNGEEKSESENHGDNIIFENAERENSFEVEKVGREGFVILNQVNTNYISTNSNQ